MAMRVVRARELADGSTALIVHLDDTKLDEGGRPDPNWLYRLHFAPPSSGWNLNDYRQNVRREARRLCQEELTRRERATDEGGTTIPGLAEGQPLP